MGFSDNSAPLLLSASATPIVGSDAEFDSEALAIPFRKPAVVDEIRWAVRASGLGALPVPWNPGGLIGCRLSLGRETLTNGFIPLWLFGPPVQDIGLTQQTLYDTDFGASVVYFSSFRWKLPVPLEVPSGMALRAEVSRSKNTVGFVIPGTTTVDITYAGRYLGSHDEISKSIRVPYVTSFITPRGQDYTESGEKDLWNPFTVPLNTQRFIGRLEYRSSAPTLDVEDATTAIYAARVRMHDSTGEVITKGDLTQRNAAGAIITSGDPLFYSVFEGARRAWTFSRQLAAKEQFYATVSGIGNSVDFANINAQISLVGWRNVEVA